MVRRNTSILGDWLVVSDRSGMTRYNSEMRMTWDGLYVDKDEWNPREPQDFVRGIPDDQSVPISRPDIRTTAGQTTVKVTALKNALSIDLTTTTGISSGDSISITLDDGIIFSTYSFGEPSGDTITLGTYLPANATAGNLVFLPGINDRTFITATGIMASEL